MIALDFLHYLILNYLKIFQEGDTQQKFVHALVSTNFSNQTLK
jgi:hypothetical protein